jgi:hypothetical protein
MVWSGQGTAKYSKDICKTCGALISYYLNSCKLIHLVNSLPTALPILTPRKVSSGLGYACQQMLWQNVTQFQSLQPWCCMCILVSSPFNLLHSLLMIWNTDSIVLLQDRLPTRWIFGLIWGPWQTKPTFMHFRVAFHQDLPRSIEIWTKIWEMPISTRIFRDLPRWHIFIIFSFLAYTTTSHFRTYFFGNLHDICPIKQRTVHTIKFAKISCILKGLCPYFCWGNPRISFLFWEWSILGFPFPPAR